MIDRQPGIGALRAVRSHLGTEFGEALEAMVRRTPGAFAGIVSDAEGYAIDFAHDVGRIDGIEVQLIGAQFGVQLFRLQATAGAQGLGEPLLLVETDTHSLVASPVGQGFVVAMLLERRANLGRALDAFATGRDTLRTLLA